MSLFRRRDAEEDSTAYQYIIEQGAIKGVQSLLLAQGAFKFGEPTEEMKASIQALEDIPRLHRMALRLLTATSWDEVLEAH